MNICVFGDSTAWGAWDTEKGGWVNRLQLYLDKKAVDETPLIYNLSISGGTSKLTLERFESEAKFRKANALIFQGGGNDAYQKGKDGPNQIAPEVFKKNIEETIERARTLTDKILYIGFKNVDESRTRPVSWKDIHYLNSEIQKYNQIMQEVCNAQGVPFLDIFGVLEEKELIDGLHPDAAGHEKIFQKVRAELEKIG
jgi:lysophospholipase L1-like esterase